MKKTVIFIYSNLCIGGIQTLIYRKSKWLIENGYNVYVVTSSTGELHSKFKDICVRIIIINKLFYEDLQFKDFISSFNYLLANINEIKNTYCIECFEPMDTVYGIYLSRLIGCKIITGAYHPCAYSKGLLNDIDYSNLFKTLDSNKSFICMNEDVMKAHEKSFSYKMKNKNIIRLPINIKEERKKFSKNKEFTVLSIGRLVDFKKYVYGLIVDFDGFYNEHLNSKLIIIGDGIERKNLIKYARQFKSYKNGKIEFLGTVPYNGLDKYIYEALMVVGMGTSLLEMASAGIPAIIAPAFVKDNISNGFNFEDDNIGDTKNSCTKTYFDYMELLYNFNDEEYKKISGQCRQAVIDNYAIDNIMKEWFEKVAECTPIVLNGPLDEFVQRSPLKVFLSTEKRKLKGKLKRIMNKYNRPHWDK